jgi:hypothetical protein
VIFKVAFLIIAFGYTLVSLIALIVARRKAAPGYDADR